MYYKKDSNIRIPSYNICTCSFYARHTFLSTQSTIKTTHYKDPFSKIFYLFVTTIICLCNDMKGNNDNRGQMTFTGNEMQSIIRLAQGFIAQQWTVSCLCSVFIACTHINLCI